MPRLGAHMEIYLPEVSFFTSPEPSESVQWELLLTGPWLTFALCSSVPLPHWIIYSWRQLAHYCTFGDLGPVPKNMPPYPHSCIPSQRNLHSRLPGMSFLCLPGVPSSQQHF